MVQQPRDDKRITSHLIDGDERRADNDKFASPRDTTGTSEERLVLQQFGTLADALRYLLGNER